MGTILIILFVIGFFMSDRQEKTQLFKEIVTTVGGGLLLFGIVAFLLDRFDIMAFERQLYFIKRILFGNPFSGR